MDKNREVLQIQPKLSYYFILNKHYAKRLPPISWAFGLFIDNILKGIVTYGKPASPYLCDNICGIEYTSKVWELNRLYTNDNLPKNSTSMLVGRSLKMLPKGLIIVSYADSGRNHMGYIYQATNFIYTGISKEAREPDTGEKHARHATKEQMKKKRIRTAKYRYVYFTDKKMKKLLTYPILPYPKGDLDNKVKKVVRRKPKNTGFDLMKEKEIIITKDQIRRNEINR